MTWTKILETYGKQGDSQYGIFPFEIPKPLADGPLRLSPEKWGKKQIEEYHNTVNQCIGALRMHQAYYWMLTLRDPLKDITVGDRDISDYFHPLFICIWQKAIRAMKQANASEKLTVWVSYRQLNGCPMDKHHNFYVRTQPHILSCVPDTLVERDAWVLDNKGAELAPYRHQKYQVKIDEHLVLFGGKSWTAGLHDVVLRWVRRPGSLAEFYIEKMPTEVTQRQLETISRLELEVAQY